MFGGETDPFLRPDGDTIIEDKKEREKNKEQHPNKVRIA